MRWFRVYTEIRNDAKIRSLAFEDRWHFVSILSLKSEGILDSLDPGIRERRIALELGLDSEATAEIKRRLMEAFLIDAEWQPCHWAKRQFLSDGDPTNAERQKRFKGKQALAKKVTVGNALLTDGNGLITPSRTDTDTDKNKNMGQQAGPSAEDLAFEEIQKAYPKREGSQRWRTARSSYRARLRENHIHADILAGVIRYSKYCDTKKITRTSLVQQAATFFGTNLGFTEPWDVTDVVRRDDLTRLTDAQIMSRCRAAGIVTIGLSRSELISRLAA